MTPSDDRRPADDASDAPDPLVASIDSAHKRFGEHEVLRGVSIDFRRGEAAVIIGPSGCGKSTLLRCINKFETLDSGSIEVNGTDINDIPETRLRRDVGMVFQQFSLFPHLSVLDNLTLAPRKVLDAGQAEARAEAMAMLELVGLPDKASSLPRQLSGGQAQRVAIARALMMHPSIMLFDEVTSALDPERVGEVLTVMKDLAERGMSMIIVTHEMDFAREVGDALYFMDEGVVVESGAPQEVLSNPQHARTRQFLQRTLR